MADAVSRRIDEHRAREGGRGRSAEKPTQIPAMGWKDILYRVKDEISGDRIGTIAAGTTFFVLLALFPALGALVSLYGLIADPVTINEHLNDLRGYLPAAVLDLVGQELTRLEQTRTGTLGVGFVGGLLVALWSANSGMKALFDALNVAYDETEKRGFFKLNLVSLGFTLGGLVFFILVLNVVIGVPLILNLLPLGPAGNLLVAVVPPIVLFAVAIFVIAVLYRYGPSRTQAQWRWVTPGSVAAAVVWVAASFLFSWYLANFADYSATYGSVGAIIGVMMWIYISMWIVLAGAELNAEIEHQTARDTTVGPEKPLGDRGATMADRVGEART
jgi:membrane protein